MTDTRDIRAETYHRSLALDRAAIDPETRTVAASLSSEFEVERWFGREVLSHDPAHVDLSRAADGLPLLFNHDPDRPIGIVEGVRIDGKKIRGTLKFSRNAKAEETWQDVQDDMLRNISISYVVHDWIESKDSDLVRVIRWTLLEASIAPVPADPTVGIGRSYQPRSPENPMSIEETAGVVATPPPSPVVDLTAIRHDLEIARADAVQMATRAERLRVADVNGVFDLPSLPRTAEFQALRARAIQDGWTADQARKIVLDALGTDSPAVDQRGVTDDITAGIRHQADLSQARQAPATVVDDGLDKWRRGISEALLVRAGIDQSKETIARARSGGLVGVRLSRAAEQYLQLCGVETRGMSDDQLAQRALQFRASGMGTSDFANVLYNTANKAMMLGWEQAPETWRSWTRIGSVNDFKATERIGLSSFSALEKVLEDGEIKYGKLTDRRETVQAYSYAKKFRLNYQTIKNDDLLAFTAIPRAMGRAGQSIIGDVVYGLLDNTGPTLVQDSTALFDTSSHKNYVAAATAPTVDTLNTAYSAMRKQKDPNSGKSLNVTAKYILAPVALEMTARVLMSAANDPGASPGSTTGKNTLAPNPFQNRFEVVTDARLDDQTNGTAAWYLAADPNIFDTIEVVFVDGIAEPYLMEQGEWDTRGIEWVTGVDFGVAALDFRGLHKYRGS